MKKISINNLVYDVTRDWTYKYEPNKNWDGVDSEKEYRRNDVSSHWGEASNDYRNKKDALLQNKLDNKVKESKTFGELFKNLSKAWGYLVSDKEFITRFYETVIAACSDDEIENQFGQIIDRLYETGKIKDKDSIYNMDETDQIILIKFLLKNQDKIFKK